MSELDDFLGTPPTVPPEAAPEPQPQPQEPAAAQADTPPPPEQRETPQAASQGPEKPADADPAEREREPQHFKELRSSVEAAKKEREDWKARAIKAETEHAELRKQFEAASRYAPPPQPTQQPGQPPPPQMDIREAMANDPSIKAAVLTRLDTSEMLLRRELGDDAVTQLQADFTAAMAEDPSLQARVLVQRDPYRWAHKHMESIRLQRSIGDDPDAYRAAIRAEIEAEMMAGRTNGNGGVQHRQSPAAGMAPSLATARNSAPLSNPGWSGPLPLDDIVSQIHRKS